MMFTQSIIFLSILFLSIISLAGLGKMIIYRYRKSFLESVFFGFLTLSFLITFTHFFFKIQFNIILAIFIIGLIISYLEYSYLLKKFDKKNLYYIFIVLIFVPIYLSQKYHEDFGYYHLPYLIALINEKIIFGLANSTIAYVHNSIWLNIMSLYLVDNNYNFTTLPTFLFYCIFVIFLLKKNLEKNDIKISNYFAIISLFYFVLKFTRISEFGNDLPAISFSILSLYFYLKFYETTNIIDKRYNFFSCFSFAVFSILIKFSCIPIFLIPSYLFFKNFDLLKKEILKFNYFFIYFLGIVFFIQQFIYTGCFLFPSTITCLDVSWFNNEFIDVKKKLELTNKSYSLARNIFTPEEYLSNFTWFPYWFKRNYPEILEHILTMILPVMVILLFSKQSTKNQKVRYKYFEIYFFAIFVFVGFAFWLSFSPVYRFSIIYFISFIFLITFSFYKNIMISKKLLIFLFLLALIFNFSKNISRISNEKSIFFGIKKITNSFIEYPSGKNDYILLLRPDNKNNEKNGWQGRLCWDIGFLCSYREINVMKNNNYLILNKLKIN